MGEGRKNEAISIILCETSHPGNIGAAARAMKTMGLEKLILVAPRCFPHSVATERASGAEDLLVNASVVATLEEAIGDYTWVLGTSARHRAFPWPLLTPEKAAKMVSSLLASSTIQKIAFVFGSEQSGLSNEQLQLCNYHVYIPSSPQFSSLNLGAAVQVVAYEIYKHLSVLELPPVAEKSQPSKKATISEVLALVKEWEKTAVHFAFMDPKQPKKLLTRLQRMLNRAQLEREEVNILRGFLRSLKRTEDA